MQAIEENYSLTVTAEDLDQYKRLDHFLAAKIQGYSRSFLKRLFELGQINAEDEQTKLSLKKMPPENTLIEINIPPAPDGEAEPENIPLEILYEDEHLIFVNKPAGMVTHPAPGNYTGTLVNAVLYHCPDIVGVGGVKRPGIVHRLDKGTSGVMVVAKNQACHEGLILLFQSHDIDRKYQALVCRSLRPPSGSIEASIGRSPNNRLKMAANVRRGKAATTHYKTLQSNQWLTHLELTLETGRTHQIRVHLAQVMQTPILMDPLYAHPSRQLKNLPEELQNKIEGYPHPFLHAKRLGLCHPISKKQIEFEVVPPEPFASTLEVAFHE